MSKKDRLWAIILAAGEGTRLAPLTECLYGERLPKQFAVLAGNRSLLQGTVERLLPLVPEFRIVVVVPLAYEGLAREQLSCHSAIRIVAQPANRGTGPGILLPLAHVLEADPKARVVVTPSDHYIADADGLLGAISAAAALTDSVPLTLVGAEPDRPETEYGWIEAGDVLGGTVRHIDRFVEKPGAARARELFDGGGLWNTFVMVAQARRLWKLAEAKMPAQAALIRACVAQLGPKAPGLAHTYEQIEDANFSRAVLESTTGLGVVRARGCGFSDWGTPERVLDSLKGTVELNQLLARLAGRSPGPSSPGPFTFGRSDKHQKSGALRQEGSQP